MMEIKLSSNNNNNSTNIIANTNTTATATATITTVREHKGTSQNDWYKYETITNNERRNLLRIIFREDVLLLERLLFGDTDTSSRKKIIMVLMGSKC